MSLSARLAAVSLALAAAAGAARADPAEAAEPEPGRWRLSAEVLATAQTGVFHDVGVSTWGFRVGMGGRERAAPGSGRRELAWLLTVEAATGGSSDGVTVREGRLGIGVRLHQGRLTGGADAELVLVDVERVSTSSPLRGTGFGGRVLGAFDFLRLGGAAAFVGLELGLEAIGWPGSPAYWPSIQAGLGMRL